MFDALLPLVAWMGLGAFLTLWWADGRRERREAEHRAERERWEAERLRLVQALAPAVTLVEPPHRERRAWTDAEEATWESLRVRDGGE